MSVLSINQSRILPFRPNTRSCQPSLIETFDGKQHRLFLQGFTCSNAEHCRVDWRVEVNSNLYCCRSRLRCRAENNRADSAVVYFNSILPSPDSHSALNPSRNALHPVDNALQELPSRSSTVACTKSLGCGNEPGIQLCSCARLSSARGSSVGARLVSWVKSFSMYDCAVQSQAQRHRRTTPKLRSQNVPLWTPTRGLSECSVQDHVDETVRHVSA